MFAVVVCCFPGCGDSGGSGGDNVALPGGEDACLSAGFLWFSNLCCGPPSGSDAIGTTCLEDAYCREACTIDAECEDPERPFCCPEYVCPNNEGVAIVDCSTRSCEDSSCPHVRDVCGED